MLGMSDEATGILTGVVATVGAALIAAHRWPDVGLALVITAVAAAIALYLTAQIRNNRLRKRWLVYQTRMPVGWQPERLIYAQTFYRHSSAQKAARECNAHVTTFGHLNKAILSPIPLDERPLLPHTPRRPGGIRPNRDALSRQAGL